MQRKPRDFKYRAGNTMEKALLIILFTLSCRIASGQFCRQVPPESQIVAEFDSQLGEAVDQSSTREVTYNCIAYDGASQGFKETTVTVRYRSGSSVFSAQARYVCGNTGVGFVWAIGTVMADAGTDSTETGCRNCMNTTPTTCTPCDPTPCGQNGMPDVYCTECICDDGYTGANCTMDIDECASAQPPCEGGGICINTMGGFTCTCPANCTGDCTACCSSPCRKGGTCTSDSQDIFTCACPPGFTGETCEEFEGGCYNDPCLNNGECVDVFDANNPLAYRCSCPIGFTGVNCESRINYCASWPCKNSGWCTSMTTGFTCTCLQGYTGSDCSEPLLTCRTDPAECGTNGVCSNRTVDSTAIYCSCNLGYTGERCEQEVTACIDDQSPCLHQGTCNTIDAVNGSVSFICNCTVGYWEGAYCTDCGLLCINGYPNGDCTGCVCNDPWTGNTCDSIVSCVSYDEDGNCDDCEDNVVPQDNICITPTNTLIPNNTGTPILNSSDSSSDTNAIIIGGAVGGVILLLMITVALCIVILYVRRSYTKEEFHVYDQAFCNKALSVVMEHNPSYDVTNTDKFPGIQTNEEEQNYECIQYLDLNDTTKMDTNPSYGMHTVENRETAFSTTATNSNMQDYQPFNSSHDHNHYDSILYHETAQHHHIAVTTDQNYGARTVPSLLNANKIKPTEDEEYGVINQPRT